MNMRKLQMAAAALSCVGMLTAPVASAAPAGQLPRPADVALNADGALSGQLVTSQGAAIASAPVVIMQNGREITRITTDANGNFQLADLRGGVYEVAAPGHLAQYRVWAPGTAPPAASKGLMVVSGDTAVLGQTGGAGGALGKVTAWIAEHPLMTAGIVAAAVAIPLAVDDDDNAS